MEKERPPVFGMIERGGQVVINLLDNVKQKTIEPLVKDTINPGTLVYTDEYSIYARLKKWGYEHKHVTMDEMNSHEMKMAMGFVKCMSTRWKASGLCCAVGCVRTVAFHKRNSRFTWGSLSSFTTCESGVKRCWARSLSYSFQKTPKPNKSAVSKVGIFFFIAFSAIRGCYGEASLALVMRRFIMRSEQVLAKTIGGIMPHGMNMIGPILGVIVLDYQSWAMQAIIMRAPGLLTASPGEVNGIDARRREAVEFPLRQLRAYVFHIGFNQRERLLALGRGHGS